MKATVKNIVGQLPNYNAEDYKLPAGAGIESLEGCYLHIAGSFIARQNKLKNLDYFPKVDKSIDLDNNKLVNLIGCPTKVHGYFSCCYNELKTLQGAPEEVYGDFVVHNNYLETLEYLPKYIKYSLEIGDNFIKSLNGCPENINGDFHCSNNSLTSMKNGPKHVEGDMKCDSNYIKNLEGFPSYIGGNLSLAKNQIQSLKNIHMYIKTINGGQINLSYTKIKSNILGLFLINGLNKVIVRTALQMNMPWVAIVNNHISKGRKGMLACQKELIENGLKEYAQL